VWRVKDQSGLGHEAPELVIADEQALRAELARLASLEPRVVRFEMPGKECLQVGLGGAWAFVEHLLDKPWKAQAALSRLSGVDSRPESIWFVCGGQGTEIPSRYLMPTAEAIEVVVECLRVGEVPSGWNWELV
jgi:hypothetical protein